MFDDFKKVDRIIGELADALAKATSEVEEWVQWAEANNKITKTESKRQRALLARWQKLLEKTP